MQKLSTESSMSEATSSLSYRSSGVNIDAGNELVERIKPHVKKTSRAGVLQGLGGFGALFELPIGKYRNPVLVSGTDGVGTKLKLATEYDHHGSVGIDLVAMCVNDIVVCGAEPLYFLDYLATGLLDVDQAELIIKGISKGCELAGCALVGGETAEMPGMYQPGDYDLAGFAVGIVEKDEIILPSRVEPGNILLGLRSSGPHSNGYSMIRKILEKSDVNLQDLCGDATLKDALLAPTRIYVKSVLKLVESIPINAIAHITGGGILENLPRVLPENTGASVSRSALDIPEIFQWLQENGNVQETEMFRTFNCGTGMIICVNPENATMATKILESCGEQVSEIGEVVQGESRVTFES